MKQYRGQHSIEKVLPQFHTKLRKLHKHFPIWFETFWLTLWKTKKVLYENIDFKLFQEKFSASFCCGFCGKWKVIENAEAGGNWRKMWKFYGKLESFTSNSRYYFFLLCGSHEIFNKLWLLLIVIVCWTGCCPCREQTQQHPQRNYRPNIILRVILSYHVTFRLVLHACLLIAHHIITINTITFSVLVYFFVKAQTASKNMPLAGRLE